MSIETEHALHRRIYKVITSQLNLKDLLCTTGSAAFWNDKAIVKYTIRYEETGHYVADVYYSPTDNTFTIFKIKLDHHGYVETDKTPDLIIALSDPSALSKFKRKIHELYEPDRRMFGG